MSEFEANTFPPPWSFLMFWFLSGGAMLLFGKTVIGPLLGAPVWVRCFFVFLPSLSLMVGVVLSFAFVRVERSGITNRQFTRWSVRWTDIETWRQLGPRGSVYLRMQDGRIRGFSSWCVYGARNDRLAQLLEQHLGPGQSGEIAH